MEELNLFPEAVEQGTKVLFFNLGEEESKTAYQMLQQLRSKGIASELFHEPAKLDKQFKYAEKKNIPFVVIIGSKEIENKTAAVKNLKTGEQKFIGFDELVNQSFTRIP
jgi:histidyl-tRNA synthetase